jgi:SAM-dependent methyltransferase
LIKGVCLEVTDTAYIDKYGAEKVTKADALDINRNNKMATIYGDLRDLSNVESNTYDCIIITQTFVMIDEYEAAIRECHRILKPGGYVLVTMPCLGPVWNIDSHFWRWTRASAEYLFKKYFPNDLLEVQTYGNALAGQCFWVGLSLDEISEDELEYNDKFFPVIVSVKVRKA